MINKQSYQIQGMRQDNLVGTGASTKFAHEIMNMRLNTTGDYTTASWTTEQGTLLKEVEWVDVPSECAKLLQFPYEPEDSRYRPIVPIGQAVLNDQWIVFATRNIYNPQDSYSKGHDFIFKYWYKEGSDILQGTVIYAGDLNFDANYPCETLAFYENENIQKVYWTDGLNQPRVVNIANGGVKYHTDLNKQFDFVQEVSLRENVTITKQTSGAGLFPPCTVKYALTYYHKYGQETNIIYDSPLYYPIKGQRGCSPDELSGDSFEIKVTHIDNEHGFDYIRLYSIVRTTENATPIVRIVADKEIASLPVLTAQDPDYNPNVDNRYALFVDTNTTGEIVDPTVLQYIGGKELVAQTFDQKNNTLFLGNVELKTKSIKEALNEYNINHNSAYDLTSFNGETNSSFTEDNDKVIGVRVNANGNDEAFYQYTNQLTTTKCWDTTLTGSDKNIECNGNSFKIKIFKWHETYRFGIQFQDIKGNWSEVIHLKDTTNNIKPKTSEENSVARFATFKYKLPSIMKQILLEEGFVKARIVCCYPSNADRKILAQGVINPTLENVEWHNNHAPDVFSSWFFRPIDGGTKVTTIPSSGYLTNNTQGNCEVQSIVSEEDNYDKYEDQFLINSSILTFHSPEISFDDSIRTLFLDNVKIDVVGYIPIQSYAAYTYVEATEPFPSYSGYKGSGLHFAGDIQLFKLDEEETGSHYVNQGEWQDRNYWSYEAKTSERSWPWILYPFHRKGSLANYIKDVNPWKVSYTYYKGSNQKTKQEDYKIGKGSILESKCLSHLLYSGSSIFTGEPPLQKPINTNTKINFWSCENFTIVDTNEVIPTKIGDLIYYGNINSIAPVKSITEGKGWNDYNNDNPAHTVYIIGNYPIKMWQTRTSGDVKDDVFGYASDPVPITFNSTAHGVFKCGLGYSLEETVPANNILPKPKLRVIDLQKESSQETRFGGEPSPNNIYLPCGPSVDLRDETGDVIVKGIEGDHYYQRYDCLKTYPRATDDTNQIVEILSFMCETRINLDGRYDRNRGLSDNTTITNTNFNLINQSYTQSNNFFTYTTLDEDFSTLSKFGNLITWTKDKVSGETVDLWTNITMASTADAEGVCGAISKIINVNDSLYCFQEHGIAQIGYNEKTALSTEAGIPLEIANSGKFSGLKYITKNVGCQNKWSISNTKNGCFFIDDSRQELLTLSQELTSLSTINGFDAFLIKQLPDSEHFKPWTPINPVNFVSYYDKLGNDVFYINKDYCLAWNEQSKTFTSFYSYNNVPLMANIGTHLLMWNINTPMEFQVDSYQSIETVTSYNRTEETVITTTGSNPMIYNDDTYLKMTYYHYKGTGGTNTATTKWIENTVKNIQQSWIRFVPVPNGYSNDHTQDWNAHFILSLEFRKNGEPFIIQFEVEGIHKETSGSNYWQIEPKPSIKVRMTPNVTEQEFSLMKDSMFLGGEHEPTFNAGNIEFVNNNYKVKSPNVQPWSAIDDGFTVLINGTSRELLCIAKIYDLNNNINSILPQGNPFRAAYQSDIKADIDTSVYDEADLVYNETTVITWTPEEQSVTNTYYTIVSKSENTSNNIWAARELPEYCKFFNTVQPYWMTIVCDGMTDKGSAFPADKVFNNVEYRADIFNKDYSISDNSHINYHNSVFNKKHVWNGYQDSKEVTLDGERKFNTWRIQLPRHYGTRDRIRNPFCYIKLKQDQTVNTQTDRMILHDLAVYFDMR